MGHKILVVEDEKVLREAIVKILEKESFEVVTAVDGDSGLSAIKSEKPDFVILDLLMPGKDGWTVLKEVRADKETKNLPVLVLTAYDNGVSIAKCADLGIVGYFVKSNHSLDEIINKVKENI